MVTVYVRFHGHIIGTRKMMAGDWWTADLSNGLVGAATLFGHPFKLNAWTSLVESSICWVEFGGFNKRVARNCWRNIT
jgi:hypothetical protein